MGASRPHLFFREPLRSADMLVGFGGAQTRISGQECPRLNQGEARLGLVRATDLSFL
jgi:hypothetical protein